MRNLYVIIVDDDQEISSMMRMRLQKDAPHLSITTVSDGPECIEHVKTHKVDCILSDYQMPVMDGIGLLSELRRLGHDTPVIFITGQGSEEVAREAFKSGAYDYFTKDIGFAHFPKIVNSVEQAVKRHRAERSRAKAETALAEERNVRRRTEKQLSRLAGCFLGFGPDPVENINQLAGLAGELLGASCALYCRLENGMLCTLGRWNTPSDYKTMDKPDGHICYDVIKNGGDELMVIPDLSKTVYQVTDSNIADSSYKAYVGKAVKFAGSPIGSLCALYEREFVPTEEDRNIFSLIASAIGVEEKRRQSVEALKGQSPT